MVDLTAEELAIWATVGVVVLLVAVMIWRGEPMPTAEAHRDHRPDSHIHDVLEQVDKEKEQEQNLRPAIAPRTRIMSSQKQSDDRLSNLASFFAKSVVISSVGLLFFALIQVLLHALVREEFIARNFPITFGLPLAATAAFCLVVVLRQWSGPIRFEAFGLKIQAGAGLVILWLLCFLVIMAAILLRL